MRACLAVLAAACALTAGCGVGTEDEPQLIEESTQQPLPATPSFDTEESPAPGSEAPPTPSGATSGPGPEPTR